MNCPARGKANSRDPLRIGIIGLGPRGLTVLERIITFSQRNPEINVKTEIFDPNEPGCGVHSKAQPDYLKLNTIASQISMFPGVLGDAESQPHTGPSLFEWCAARDLLLADDHLAGSDMLRPVKPNDFLPRRMLGEYLSWFYKYLMMLVPQNLCVTLRRVQVVDADLDPESGQLSLLAEDGETATVGYLFITIGHSRRTSRQTTHSTASASSAHELPQSVSDIRSNATVAVRGVGLTAMDVMVSVIHAWGGKFVRDLAGGLHYLRSGREGKLLFITRAGRPYCTRPNTTTNRKMYRAQFVTTEGIEWCMQKARGRKFSFKEVVLPLMRLEMSAAYYMCCTSRSATCADSPTPDEIGPLMRKSWKAGKLAATLGRLESKFGRGDLGEHLLLGVPADIRAQNHREWFRNYLARDVAEGKRGLAESPLKSALEVWRDLRDELRAIVDGRWFTLAAREEFFRDYAPMIDRLVAGPQWERSAEFICLIEEGIAEVVLDCRANDMSEGWSGERHALQRREPNHPQPYDYVIRAYLPPSGFMRDDTSLLRNLAARGLIGRVDGPSTANGVRVNAFGNVIGGDGMMNVRAWVFGPPAEGSTYYNHYVPSPDGPSRAYVDANRAIRACFDGACSSKQKQLDPAAVAGELPFERRLQDRSLAR